MRRVMSEIQEPREDQPQDGYEPPSVEKLETEDYPAVTAAGVVTR
jgi:hypothetical protein